MVVVVAALSACGGSSNSTNGVVYGAPATTVLKASAAGTLLGGSVQGSALAATFSNVSTTAGTAGVFGSADLVTTKASFYQPNGITTDGKNLYIADYKNHTIRQMVLASGVVTTVAGKAGIPGSADGALGTSTFYSPNAITTDGTFLYVTDSNFTVRKIEIATQITYPLAGLAGNSGSIDATGTAARFNLLKGITTDGNNIYVSDYNNNTVRWIDKVSGVVKTLAGTAGSLGSKDGVPGVAQFNRPTRITCDGPYLYVCDFYSRTIRRIEIKSGIVDTIAGKADTAPSTDDADATVGTNARFNQPNGITTDGFNLYVSDSLNNTIRRISLTPPYAVDKIAGITFDQNKYKTSTQVSPGSVNSVRGTPSFYMPLGITSDGTSLFVADSNNHLIRSIK
jgi:sugar lactone lactonase YvrE